MRVLEIHIERWRNLRDFHLLVSADTTLVCLVGQNGTGKSNVLELLAATALSAGIAPRIDARRRHPFDEEYEFEILFEFSDDALPKLAVDLMEDLELVVGMWDRTIRVRRWRDGSGSGEQISAGGSGDPYKLATLAGVMAQQIRDRAEINLLFLDSQRSYPKPLLSGEEYLRLIKYEWDAPKIRKPESASSTQHLYEQWLVYMATREARSALDFAHRVRLAGDHEAALSDYVDPHRGYREALRRVLPYLTFLGVDLAIPDLVFDNTGVTLPFSELSSGEREVAFLVGQIERFGLRRGLLLIDEPELHLHPELLRTWLGFARETVQDGQVWVATHAYEAVEIAGEESTFVLGRAESSRSTDKVFALADRPAYAALASVLGRPAFSLARNRFVYIEGNRASDRRRFERMCPSIGEEVNRFIGAEGESGVKTEVAYIRRLAETAPETERAQLRVGGIIDRELHTRDWAVEAEGNPLRLHVLGCYEVENLFLQPHAIAVIRGDVADLVPAEVMIRSAADVTAGEWIGRWAVQVGGAPQVGAVIGPLRRLTWQDICDEPSRLIIDCARRLASGATAAGSWTPQLESALVAGSLEFALRRLESDWWKWCAGKEVLQRVAFALEFPNPEPSDGFQTRVLELWEAETVPWPEEVLLIRTYIDRLGT